MDIGEFGTKTMVLDRVPEKHISISPVMADITRTIHIVWIVFVWGTNSESGRSPE